jgi:hypothetical protein
VGLSVYPLIVARQGLGKHVPAQRGNVEGVVLYAIHVVSKESRRLGLTTSSCQLPVINTTYVPVFRICEVGAMIETLNV